MFFMEPYWDLIKRIVTESDLVLEVLDARLIQLSRNELVEELIEEVERPMIFVINKTDLVDKEKLKKDVKELRKKGEVVFISTKVKGSTKILLYAIKKVFKKYGKRYIPPKEKYAPKQQFREAKAGIVVGILGYPNVGKSSIINSLAYKKKVKVSKRSGTTHGIHWINVTKEIKLIDSPGVIPLQTEDDVRYGLIGARDTEALKNPELVAYAVIKFFLRSNKKILEDFYKIKIGKENTEEIVEMISQKKSFLLGGGRLDIHRAVMMMVRDWQQGRLRL